MKKLLTLLLSVAILLPCFLTGCNFLNYFDKKEETTTENVGCETTPGETTTPE